MLTLFDPVLPSVSMIETIWSVGTRRSLNIHMRGSNSILVKRNRT